VNGHGFLALCRRVREDLAQDHRYKHTLSVARLADALAQRHGENPGRARIAGMLHDLARLYAPERLLDECLRRGMQLESFERQHPIVLHARLGAELAHERYGINDETILSAIRRHTLGAAAMSRLDSIVYLADALEPGRDFRERADLWQLAFADLDAAMLATLRSTLSYLDARGVTVAPATLAALDFFAAKEKKTA
jgi:predicted HD superfamily hydrolase involved in NAD metabolism